MGQKTNPNIFQINKTNDWNSRYIEKKSKDFYLHTIKDLEVKKFIYKFFKNHNFNIHSCNLNYANNSLNMYISYQQDYDSISLINNINKIQKIKLVNNSILRINNNKSYSDVFKNIKNFNHYKNLIYKKYFLKKKTGTIRISFLKRVKILRHYKTYLNLKKHKKIKNLLFNTFLNQFFKSLNLFYSKLININLILEPLNSKLIHTLKKKEHDIIKKKLIKLKKYQKSNFFKEGINTIFALIRKKNSAFLLSNFVSIILKKLKYHNFFFKFLKSALTILLSDKIISSKIQGIKIKIKGRLNKAPRAKNKIITIGNLPLFTITSNIDYSETTGYTANGALGVKVWVCYI